MSYRSDQFDSMALDDFEDLPALDVSVPLAEIYADVLRRHVAGACP